MVSWVEGTMHNGSDDLDLASLKELCGMNGVKVIVHCEGQSFLRAWIVAEMLNHSDKYYCTSLWDLKWFHNLIWQQLLGKRKHKEFYKCVTRQKKSHFQFENHYSTMQILCRCN